MFSTLAFGAIGFADDYIKVVHKRNLGLTARQKLALQFLVSAAVAVALVVLRGAGCVFDAAGGAVCEALSAGSDDRQLAGIFRICTGWRLCRS